ncbi:MAG: hypothetical protein AAFO75_03560, partial [Pseudomonadota bacterium]
LGDPSNTERLSVLYAVEVCMVSLMTACFTMVLSVLISLWDGYVCNHSAKVVRGRQHNRHPDQSAAQVDV